MRTQPRRGRVRLAGVCAALVLGGAGARAQESPELPPKPVTAAQPTTQFYKGKGPGRGNSYVERYEEDYAYLRDPAKASDFFDPLKFIALTPDGDIYLT